MKEPKKINDQDNLLKEKWTEKMEEHKFQTLCELWQMAKQFKYIDSNTNMYQILFEKIDSYYFLIVF